MKLPLLEAWLSRVFNSWPERGYRNTAWGLAQLVEAGLLRVACTRAPYACGPFVSTTTETGEHARLKHTAVAWLLACGEPAPLVERGYFGQARHERGPRADVLAPGLGWVVECGNTDPDRAIEALRAGFTRFALLPYTCGQETAPVIYFEASPGAVLQPPQRNVAQNRPQRGRPRLLM